MKDANNAEITITETPASPNQTPLKPEWDAADTIDKKLVVLAKALNIL